MKKIPAPIISVLATYLPQILSHAELDNLFLHADAPGDSPPGSKPVKTKDWLQRINKESNEPMVILGRLVEEFMETPDEDLKDRYLPGNSLFNPEARLELKGKLGTALQRHNFQYMQGGFISDGTTAPSRSLQDLIKGRDFPAIEVEFNRSLENVHTKPREAVSAACNILESIFKIYIADEGLTRPTKQDLQGLWKVVRADLGFDPSSLEDDDLRKIISGIFSVVDGIGAFRTHASSAHGQGRKMYTIQPRHARLAIHSAHTVALYVMESWDHKKATRNA
jgi:hypothetical protein